MIEWSIQAAISSRCFDRIIVSTDDNEIAYVAQSSGAEVPFLRSGELADDMTPIVPVVVDALDQVGISDNVSVCCLFATVPFIDFYDLKKGHEIFHKTCAPFVLTVTTFPYPVQRGLRRNAKGEVEMLNPEHAQSRSQDLEETFHDAGQFYWALAKSWRSQPSVFCAGTVGMHIPRFRVQDIDTIEDWETAEHMMRIKLTDIFG